MLSMGYSLQQTQTLTLAERQTLLIRQKLNLRLLLIQQLRGDEYSPDGKCPTCERKLTPVEIIAGFNTDVNDFTTACSGCGYRFTPRLISVSNGISVTVPFYCEAQVLNMLPPLVDSPPEHIAREHVGIYQSAVLHCGSLKSAFSKIGMRYNLEKAVDWKAKLQPFLGHLPDVVIAEHANISASQVSRLRKKLGIPRYSEKKELEEIEDEY